MSTELVPTTNEKPPRRFPAPCWGQAETLALIEAYRERWYALRRGYLRTADWDAVAEAISVSAPVEPAKTSAQCRHKIEKLRQRYRTEKQRSLSLSTISLPSSWVFFDVMDAMENNGGPNHGNPLPNSSISNNSASYNSNVNYASVLRIKSVGDRSLVENVTKLKNSKTGFDPNPVNLGFRPKFPKFEGNYKNPSLGFEGNYKSPNVGFEGNYKSPNLGFEGNYKSPNLGFEGNYKSPNVGFEGNYKNPNVGFEGNYKSPNLGYAYTDDGSDGDDVADPGFGSGVRFRMPFEEKVVAPVLKAKKTGRVQGDYGASYGPNQYYMNGFNEELPPGFRVKGKTNTNPGLFYSGVDSRGSNSVRCEMNTDIPNGVPCFGYGLGKKSGGKRGVKRERGGAIDEMISSIKLFGEGYVRTEKMKMEMAREMEKTRMEMELKRNELLLESQRQIIDAFVSVMLENNNDNNNNKKKETPSTTTVVPEES